MYKNKRVVSQPPPPRNATTAAASAAAALAFAKKQNADAGLSAAAAAAALRSHATTPIPVGEIQTKRMVRRGSTSSYGSNAGSILQQFGRPGLQRRTSSSSMTERTFRSPSPGPNRRRAPSISSISEVPQVPPLPSKTQVRPMSYDPQMRTSMTSPTPSTGSRLPPRKGPSAGNLAKVPEQRERENVEAIDRRSVNFSRPMSPPPIATAQREVVRTRPASSQGFYPVQNNRAHQQPSQAPRQTSTAVKKSIPPPRAESILEEPAESPPSRKAASATTRPASATPRAKLNTGPISTTTKPGLKPAAQTTGKVTSQPAAKPSARPTSAVPQSSPRVTSRPASAMSQPRQPLTSGTAQTKAQPQPRPASAMAQSRSDQPAWPPSALVQQMPPKTVRPASALSQTRTTTPGVNASIARNDINERSAPKGPSKIATNMMSTKPLNKPSGVATLPASSSITIPSPSQDQMRTFQSRTGSTPFNPAMTNIQSSRAVNTTGEAERQVGQSQVTRPPVAKRTSTSSITTQQRSTSFSQSITNLAPTVNAKRTPSASPARSARFSSAPLLDAAKYNPPPRATSPAKSALKPASLRTSSPESSYRQGTSDNSDSRSVVSVESSSKRKKAVNFDETPQILTPGKGLTSSTKSMWMAEPAPEMSRTPALPSFESVRGRKGIKDSNATVNAPSSPLSAASREIVSDQPGQDLISSTDAVPDYGTTASVEDHLLEPTVDRNDFPPADDGKDETVPSPGARKTSDDDVPYISVMPATPRPDDDIESSTTVNVPATIPDDTAVPALHGQENVVSGAYIPGSAVSTAEIETSTQSHVNHAVLPGAYTRTISSFAPGTSTYTSAGLPIGLGPLALTSTDSTTITEAYAYWPGESSLNQGEAMLEPVNGIVAHTGDQAAETDSGEDHELAGEDHDLAGEDHDLAGEDHELAGEDHGLADEDNELAEHHAETMEDHSDVDENENRALSAIYEGPAVDHLKTSDTHPAFRSPNMNGEEGPQHMNAPAAEEDWERVRAYWSSLSEQRKQQLEYEAGIVREAKEQLHRDQLARDERAQLDRSARQISQHPPNRYTGAQAPLPPWPDQQYQQSVRRGPPMKQPARPQNQRAPSDPPMGRPQSALVGQRQVPPTSVRPASVGGNSPSKSAPPQSSKPLKGVLKNANAPQPPLARTFSNDSSGSESSFRKERLRKRGNSGPSMKRTMRAPLPPAAGSYENRPTSPTPIKGSRNVSSSASHASGNRPLRTSMRAAPEAGPTSYVPEPAPLKPSSKGGFGNPVKQKVPTKLGSKFKSRFDDSSDEEDSRPMRRKIGAGGLSKSGGLGGFGKSSGGFKSRIADSDDEDTKGSPTANGHAQGSSLLSGTMRHSIDGSPKKRGLFGVGKRKGEEGIYEDYEGTPTSPTRQSKMLATMRSSEPDLPQSSNRPSVFRRLSLSRSSQTIPGTELYDPDVPVPPIPDEYRSSGTTSGGLLAAKIASAKAPLSNGTNGTKEEIFSSRTGKKKRFQGLRRALGLND